MRPKLSKTDRKRIVLRISTQPQMQPRHPHSMGRKPSPNMFIDTLMLMFQLINVCFCTHFPKLGNLFCWSIAYK